MQFSTLFLISTGLLGSLALANPAPTPVEVAPRAKYTIHCTGGLDPPAKCLAPESKCDSYGTYHPKDKEDCKKCGCQATS